MIDEPTRAIAQGYGLADKVNGPQPGRSIPSRGVLFDLADTTPKPEPTHGFH